MTRILTRGDIVTRGGDVEGRCDSQWMPGDVVMNYSCSHCDAYAGPLVVLGEPYGWESGTALVCRACMVKALETLDAVARGDTR